MIELIVAFTLLAIALGMVTNALISGFHGTSKSIAHRKAEHVVEQALDQIEMDTRSARARHRSADIVRETSQLKRALLENVAIYDPRIPVLIGGALDVQDVKAADGNTFAYETDVLPDTIDATDGISSAELTQMFECVVYRSTVTGSTWAVTRDVAPDMTGGCSAATTGQRTYLVPPQSTTATPAPASIFSYDVVCGDADASDSLTCQGGISGTASNPCDAKTVASATGARLNYIVAVNFDLSAIVDRKDAAASRSLKGTVGLRTRQEHDYRAAMGCEN